MSDAEKLAAMLKSVNVSDVGDDTYVFLSIEGRGFCAGKIMPEFTSLAKAWERRRQNALGLKP